MNYVLWLLTIFFMTPILAGKTDPKSRSLRIGSNTTPPQSHLFQTVSNEFPGLTPQEIQRRVELIDKIELSYRKKKVRDEEKALNHKDYTFISYFLPNFICNIIKKIT